MTYVRTKFPVEHSDQCQPALRKFLFICASRFLCFHQRYGLSFQLLSLPVWMLRIYMFSEPSKHVNTGLPVQIRAQELQVHVAPGAYIASPNV